MNTPLNRQLDTMAELEKVRSKSIEFLTWALGSVHRGRHGAWQKHHGNRKNHSQSDVWTASHYQEYAGL